MMPTKMRSGWAEEAKRCWSVAAHRLPSRKWGMDTKMEGLLVLVTDCCGARGDSELVSGGGLTGVKEEPSKTWPWRLFLDMVSASWISEDDKI